MKRVGKSVIDVLRHRLSVAVFSTLVSGASATQLQQVAIQDLNGYGAYDVQNQTDGIVYVAANDETHQWNRKAMFLFDLSDFGGCDIRDQYIQDATFSIGITDSSGHTFRLYGFTDTTNNNDSSWNEDTTSQSDPLWPVCYHGAAQYPAGDGVRLLASVYCTGGTMFYMVGDLYKYLQWGAGRRPAYGHSAENPDARITLLIAKENLGGKNHVFCAREFRTESSRPTLLLDVRFPALIVSLNGRAVEDDDTVNLGSFLGLEAPVSFPLVMDNLLGESLSILHVKSMTLEGSDAGAFSLTTPNGTDFDLAQGSSTSGYTLNFDPEGAWAAFHDARLVITCNDLEHTTFTVNLLANHDPVVPAVAILEPPATTNVEFEVTSLPLSGTYTNIAGRLYYHNSLFGNQGITPIISMKEGTWRVSAPLAPGNNVITISGTNVAGRWASDTVTIIRETDDPAITILEPVTPFIATSNQVDQIDVGGSVNRFVVGDIQWFGANGLQGTFPAKTEWQTQVPLVEGLNELAFIATNRWGVTASATLTVVCQSPEMLAPGDIVILGWGAPEASSGGMQSGRRDFSIVALTPLPSGTVLFFTDNGCSTTGEFLGASATTPTGLESLCALATRRGIRAGTILRTDEPGRDYVWIKSGRIMSSAAGNYNLPTFECGRDQLTAFQSRSDNPLLNPESFLFTLDDTGAFEPPVDMATGDVPPGLTAGETAITLPRIPSSYGVLICNVAPHYERMHKLEEWWDYFTDLANWQALANGDLPGGFLWIGELAITAVEYNRGRFYLTFRCAYEDNRPYSVLHRPTLLQPEKEVATGHTTEGPIHLFFVTKDDTGFYRVKVEME